MKGETKTKGASLFFLIHSASSHLIGGRFLSACYYRLGSLASMAWSFLVWVQAGSGLYFLGILKEKKTKDLLRQVPDRSVRI